MKMNLTTDNANKFLGATVWVRWLGNHVKRLYVGQWPNKEYYYMYPDGATCCPIPSPYSKDMPLEMLRIETDEKLKIHPGHTATESYHTLNDMREESREPDEDEWRA